MLQKDIDTLERYCELSRKIQSLEKERKALRAEIDKMRLWPGFRLELESGAISVTNGARKLIIGDFRGVVARIGGGFFRDNVNLPIGALKEEFGNGIIEELEAKRLVKIEFGSPILKVSG